MVDGKIGVNKAGPMSLLMSSTTRPVPPLSSVVPWHSADRDLDGDDSVTTARDGISFWCAGKALCSALSQQCRQQRVPGAEAGDGLLPRRLHTPSPPPSAQGNLSNGMPVLPEVSIKSNSFPMIS